MGSNFLIAFAAFFVATNTNRRKTMCKGRFGNFLLMCFAERKCSPRLTCIASKNRFANLVSICAENNHKQKQNASIAAIFLQLNCKMFCSAFCSALLLSLYKNILNKIHTLQNLCEHKQMPIHNRFLQDFLLLHHSIMKLLYYKICLSL